jgi:hypothetical protein
MEEYFVWEKGKFDIQVKGREKGARENYMFNAVRVRAVARRNKRGKS